MWEHLLQTAVCEFPVLFVIVIFYFSQIQLVNKSVYLIQWSFPLWVNFLNEGWLFSQPRRLMMFLLTKQMTDKLNVTFPVWHSNTRPSSFPDLVIVCISVVLNHSVTHKDTTILEQIIDYYFMPGFIILTLIFMFTMSLHFLSLMPDDSSVFDLMKIMVLWYKENLWLSTSCEVYCSD